MMMKRSAHNNKPPVQVGADLQLATIWALQLASRSIGELAVWLASWPFDWQAHRSIGELARRLASPKLRPIGLAPQTGPNGAPN